MNVLSCTVIKFLIGAADKLGIDNLIKLAAVALITALHSLIINPVLPYC